MHFLECNLSYFAILFCILTFILILLYCIILLILQILLKINNTEKIEIVFEY